MMPISLRGLVMLFVSGCFAFTLAQGRPAGAHAVLRGADEEFRFPDDLGGRWLAKLLPPPAQMPLPPEAPSGPRRWLAPAALEKPDLPLPPQQASPARLPVAWTAAVLSPRPLPEETGLTGQKSDPEPPKGQELPAGPRVRLPVVDVNQPVPLPVLAQPLPDRAPLDDPTSEVSLAGALKAAPPVRNLPASFLRLVLPDPYEHRNAVRTRTPLAEEPTPPVSLPRLPRP